MHTIQHDNCALHFNSDLAGEAKLVSQNPGQTLVIQFPGEILRALVGRQNRCSWATGKHDEECDMVTGLKLQLDEKHGPLMKAMDKIAELCGCAQWDYAGQVVRDVEMLKDKLAKAYDQIGELEEELSDWRMERTR